MIAKITRGSSAAGLARYLHGPGTGTTHEIEVDGQMISGGVVISASVPNARGDIDGRRWGRWLDRAANMRPEIRNPVWHCSLNLAPDHRRLSTAEWVDAVDQFREAMKIPEDNPWVVVQHDDRGIHLVVSRVDDAGGVWHARNDRRQAQTARNRIEQRLGLVQAPLQKRQAVPTPWGPLQPVSDYHLGDGSRWRTASRRGSDRMIVEKQGTDANWRIVKNGARTLALAIARETSDPRRVDHARQAFPHPPELTQTAKPSSSDLPNQAPTRIREQGKGRSR